MNEFTGMCSWMSVWKNGIDNDRWMYLKPSICTFAKCILNSIRLTYIYPLDCQFCIIYRHKHLCKEYTIWIVIHESCIHDSIIIVFVHEQNVINIKAVCLFNWLLFFFSFLEIYVNIFWKTLYR